MRRLLDSARIYRMESPYDQATLSQARIDLIRLNGFKACYIRPLIYRGYDSLGVNPFPVRWTSPSCCGTGAPTSRRKPSKRA